MIAIALTGGVATGKSSVLGRLAEIWGEEAAWFSADAAVHELLTSPPIKTKLHKVFGGGIIDGAGEVDRGQLRRLVFRNPPLRRQLEAILHPGVFAAGQVAFNRARDSKRTWFVYEIPLLYEVESPLKRDLDLVVAASEEVQRLRMAEKRGLDSEIIEELLNAQLPIAEKVRRATVVIWNDGTETELEEQVWLLTRRLDRLAPAPLPHA